MSRSSYPNDALYVPQSFMHVHVPIDYDGFLYAWMIVIYMVHQVT